MHSEQPELDLDPVISEAIEELQLAVNELRELASGLHPAVLDEGLGPALESLADRTPLPTSVELDSIDGRLAPELELAAYFLACEAITNAVKHAHAHHLTVRAHRRNGLLSIEVSDDGMGGADSSGSGLRGIADRIEANGGQLKHHQQTRPRNLRQRRNAMRVVIADDNLLMRNGVVRLLTGAGFDIVAEVEDADALRDAVRDASPRRGRRRHSHATHPDRRRRPRSCGTP